MTVSAPSNRHAMNVVRITEPDQTARWDAYVDAHPKGTIFHTTAMVDVFRSARHHDPFAIAAVNGSGDIVALLVAVRVATVPGVLGRFASRSIFYAEPLCNENEEGRHGLAALLRAHDQQMRPHTLYSEVRPMFAPAAEQAALRAAGYDFCDYWNYVVDLAEDSTALWQRLSKSTRQKMRRTLNRGVRIVSQETHAGIDRMYELVRLSYRRAKVPLADASLFHAALDRLPAGTVQVRLALYEDVAVAGGISLVHKGIVYAWYGGSQRFSHLVPFDCLTWDEIEWGSQNGQKLYDFGGAGWPDQPYGPRDFKAKFGGRRVSFGRYRQVYAPWTLRIAELGYRTVRRLGSLSESRRSVAVQQAGTTQPREGC